MTTGQPARPPHARPPHARPLHARPLHARPLHTRPWALALVALGGTAGTLCRHGVEALLGNRLPLAPGLDLPIATLSVNVAGAFLLGVLLTGLALAGPDEGVRRAVRLTLGTGFLGGFTTYSTFAVQSVQSVQLAGGAAPWGALGYGALSLGLGLAAAWLGIVLAGRVWKRARATGVEVHR